MATITTNTYLDGGTARTAGETWTINGGILTIRTDTRWHADAPASMLGSLGALAISATLGGGVLVDATNVREVAFNTGAGVVPAIGTSVTQGGVSGYLLGIYANLASAPTAVGAAMPATGIIKFREVTGGAFAAGAIVGVGMTANATGADVTSWIEVVHDQAIAITVPRLGFYRTRGAWYELGVTSGSIHQQVQIPTNGGGTGTRVPAVWIETGVGTGVYEKYIAVSSTYFNTTNLGTDDRSKYVLMDTDGIIRIGGDGTNAIGYLPTAGCRIRIPNILGHQTTAANRAANLVPHATLATRPDFVTTSAGEIDMEYMMNDWYHLFTAAYKVRMVHCATMDIHSTANEASPTELEDYCTGVYQAGSISFTAANNPVGGTVTDCKFMRPDAASNAHPFSLTSCANYEFAGDIEVGVITYARSTGGASFFQCRDIIQTGIFRATAVTFTLSVCSDFDIEFVRYVDRIVGTTNATIGKYAVSTSTSCNSIMIRGVDFGGYANVHPYAGIFNSGTCSNITFRNAGTYAAPIGGSTNAPAYIYADSGNNDGVRVQRCFLTETRTGLYVTVNTSKNQTFERLGGTVGSTQTLSINTLAKGMRSASNSVGGGASVYGSHFFDMFESNTAGRVWLALNEPTAFSLPYYEAVSLGTGAGFTSGGQISMPNLGDQIIFEMPYYAIGHTAFANSAATLTGTGTGNFSYEYQIDVNDGTGWNGTWSTLNGTNLSAETIDPVDGFKLKYRITCTSAATTNALTYIRINTVSTSVAQSNALYPLDYATIELTGLTANSRVQLYDTTNAVELYNDVVTDTSLIFAAEYIADFDVRIRVMYQSGATAKTFVEFTDSVTINGLSRSITQVDDSIYVDNAVDGSAVTDITIVDGTFLVEVDTGVVSLQQIYAYETYWLYTEEGIRDESRFITAVDQANYVFEDFKIKNVQTSPATLVITGGYMKDSVTEDAIDVIDTSGGTVFLAPEHVVPIASGGGGGATAAEVWSYPTRALSTTGVSAIQAGLATEANATTNKNEILTDLPSEPDNASITAIKAKTDNLPTDPTSTADLTVVNNNVQKASLLIPATENL